MTVGKRIGRLTAFWFAAVLVAIPARSRAATLVPQASGDSDRVSLAREAEQDAQDRAQEKADRDQEKRDREEDRSNRAQEMYESGRDALDDARYQQAEETFSHLAQMNGPETDAALYWKAYAENMQGKKDSALASLADLKQRFPQSRWLKDAGALEIQVRQSTGKPPQPEAQSDEDLKILALQGVMNSDPERGMTISEKLLNGTGSPKEKAKVLFVLAQSGSPQAMDTLARIAKGQSNPDLQRKAVEYLGIFGGAKSRALLGEVYASSSDVSVKRAVLRSYMISGYKQDLFNAAKNEKNEDLKREAIRQLGISGGQAELQQLYQTEPSTDIRREILQGFFLAGDSQKLVEAAKNEKDPDLRRTAIRNLGLIGGDASSRALQDIYAKETDPSLKKEVLNAYFLQGNAKALVAIAKTEKDPDLKKTAVEKLSLMGSKEATDYLMELLNK
ncbi:MAG TPA: HEAT repeat domain-containing protein [Terriglobales bacterium]|nr:HEAT repeat domain-containing protein [Terriglobales bacterium]